MQESAFFLAALICIGFTTSVQTAFASVTVIQIGVVLHQRKEFTGTSGYKEVANCNRTKSSSGPIGLQDHGNPMHFRNIWIRNLGEYNKP